MEVAVCLVLLVVGSCVTTGAALGLQDATVTTITRLNNGDVFSADGGECNSDSCVGLSSGTAIAATTEDGTASKGPCNCQCHRHLPAFREDLHICVDDIHECVLAPFVSGSTSQKIPFVFLPLKGQIIHPSKEISFAGVKMPICAVSGSKFLTESGWIDLRNSLDADVPFRLYRDEGRTFLQWIGEVELRKRMSGRLILVHLLCRELTTLQIASDIQSIFTPCVAFRVVGTPSKYLYNVSEVTFSADAHAADEMSSNGLSISEYVAIGISSILLGLIYVASVFLYLHIRKRKKDSAKETNKRDNQDLSTIEEGIVKNNPLLGLSRHFSAVDNSYSDSGSSDTDLPSDLIQRQDDRKKNIQITTALMHPQHSYNSFPYSSKTVLESISQDSSSIEKLPEENVSIVETLEGREERPDSIKAITSSTRRKLYFNPAYFEPELLLAPPPAALEFLTKIREVISIAKQKMACKRFSPSLLGIPEEESNFVETTNDQLKALSSRRSSMISLKRENSRRRTCTGCPACEPQDLKALCGKLPEFPSLVACKSCTSSTSESKQRSIQKWLEDVPMLKPIANNNESSSNAITKSLQALEDSIRSPRRLRSPTRSLSPEHISAPIRAMSPRPASESGHPRNSIDYNVTALSMRSQPSLKPRKRLTKTNTPSSYRKPPVKPKAPPPPLPMERIENKCAQKVAQNLPPPDMINEAIVIENKLDEPEMPTIKKNMKAVINEFTIQQLNKNKMMSSNSSFLSKHISDYETDSLERTGTNKGYNTPTEYGDLSSSQPSPSLSSALPMAEEMTIRNAILNTKTGNMTVSRISMESLRTEDNHEYELIVLRKGENRNNRISNLYKLPEMFQKNNGYSLVSEVYVNNNYNNGSADSSNCSTLDKRKAKIKYDQPIDKPGRLTIEVEDCPDNYIRVEDSDNFEPDTLDRKPSKRSISSLTIAKDNNYVDSLERPSQILLRTTGSFKSTTSFVPSYNNNNGSTTSYFQRNFGSLREIYEYKTRNGLRRSMENLASFDGIQARDQNELIKWGNDKENDERDGITLTLEERHAKRQRLISQNLSSIPPDVIPPPPHNNSPIYERPKPPRKILIGPQETSKPPIPPKNGNGRSTSQMMEKEENVSASANSDLFCNTPSLSMSGASVSPNSSDYETCTLGDALKNNLEVSNTAMLNRLINSDNVNFKNSINDQFILQATTITSSPSFMPVKSLRSLMDKKGDVNNNNNNYFFPNRKGDNIKKEWHKLINRPQTNTKRKLIDSGYLSTDSNESNRKQNDSERETSGGGSETDESLCDGHSESGAESVETHSVFFGSYRKHCLTDSRDSGSTAELKVNDSVITPTEDCASTDSETMSYTTVVPVGGEKSVRSSTRSSIIVQQ